MFKRSSGAVAVAVVVMVAGCSSSTDEAAPSTGTAAPTASTSVASTTTPTTSAPPTTVPPTTEATTSTSSTTTSTTTTSSTTTTTIDPGSEADLQALFVLSGIRDGTATDLIASLIDALEPFPLDRVDLLSARVEDSGAAYLIIVGTSGYNTDDFQIEAAIETVTGISTIWDTEAFGGEGDIKVGLDVTVDGRNWIIDHADMIALLRRQATPQEVLGV